MSQSKHALTILADPALHAKKDDEVQLLQEAAVAQMAAVQRMESNAAKAGVIVGLTLHRVKASLPRGGFRIFIEEVLPVGNKWTPKTAVKNASFYMRLALVFIEKSKVQKPDILALPGDPLSLELGDNHAAKRFMEKLNSFTGDLSLNELLIKHGIKGVGLKSGLENENDPTPPESAPSTEDYYSSVAERIYGFREIVTSRESLTRLTPEQLQTLDAAVTDAYSQFKKLLAETGQGRPTIDV